MAQANIKFSIGCYPVNPQPQNSALYSAISLKAYCKKEEIEQIQKSVTAQIGKYRMPFITISIPQFMSNDKKINGLVEKYKANTLKKNNLQYFLCEPMQEDQAKLIKKVSKAFSQLTKLNNELYFNAMFYDVETILADLKKKQKHVNAVLLERFKLQGLLKTDEDLLKKFQQEVKKIAPKFAQSPIMGFLSLLHNIEVDIELQSYQQLEQATQQILGFKAQFKQPDEQHIIKAFECKDPINFYISFGKLGVIHINVQTRLFALLFETLLKN